MKSMMAAAVAAVAIAGAGTAQAQATDDDWEFAEDPARGLTVAASRYDAGPSIIAQCREGALALMLVGMPAGTGAIELNATRADGRSDTQAWRPAGSDGVLRSTIPARDLRFLRGGGAYAVRTGEGVEPAFAATFDLPTQSANLDRVLAACGWDLADDRDQAPRAQGASLTDPDARAPRRSTSRSITQRRSEPRRPEPPAEPRLVPAEQQISCMVRNGRLTECRAMHAPVAGAPDPEAALRFLDGRELHGAEARELEGKVFYHDASHPMVVVIRERLIG